MLLFQKEETRKKGREKRGWVGAGPSLGRGEFDFEGAVINVSGCEARKTN